MSLSPGIDLPALFTRDVSPESNEAIASKDDQLHFVLAALRALAASEEEATLRVYLDPAWEDLAPSLLNNGCEVMLMNSSSPGPNPARLWRLLAFEDELKAVTFIDMPYLFEAENYLKRNNLLKESKLRIWRTPLDRAIDYAPVNPGCFGTLQAYPAQELMCAYLWHLQAGIPLLNEIADWAAAWNSQALEESFLLAAFYPRAAFDGMLSIIEASEGHSRGLILDVEYATWANPESEILFIQSSSNSSSIQTFCEGYTADMTMEKFIHFYISA